MFADLFFEAFGRFLDGRVIVPLPTIEKHKRERGFDHTALLARRLARACGGRCERLLQRQNNTVQVGASAEVRKRQAESAYGAVPKKIDVGLKYVLLDDVWTTGSSMTAACNVIQKAGVKDISAVLIAKSG